MSNAYLVRFDEEHKCYEFRDTPNSFYGSNEGYWFTEERCKTKDDLLGWILHLSEKSWFTGEMCHQFIVLFMERTGINCWRKL